MNGELRTIGSSNAPNLEGRFAVDNNLATWWQPEADDAQPTLQTDFLLPSTIRSVRIIWRDVGLDTARGASPGAIRYRVELETSKDKWSTIIDRSQSTDDLLIDYRECPQASIGSRARLTILEWPKGTTPAVTEFTLFGTTN